VPSASSRVPILADAAVPERCGCGAANFRATAHGPRPLLQLRARSAADRALEHSYIT
jgi:hypothetical protein